MVLDGSRLVNRVSGMCPLICWGVSFCMCFFKSESVIVSRLTINCQHVVNVLCEVAIVLHSRSVNLFRDTATGPNLGLTTNHVCLLCSLDFGGLTIGCPVLPLHL